MGIDLKRAPESSDVFIGRTWLRDDILKWSTLDEPCLLLIGAPGIGKSAFLRQFIKETSDSVLAAHVCKGSDSDTLKSGRFVKFVADKFCEKISEYHKLLESRPRLGALLSPERLIDNPLTALDHAVIGLAWEIVHPPSNPMFLIVDAIDESLALRGEVIPLVRLLASRFDRWPRWIRLIFSTRHEPAVLELFAGERQLVIDPEDPKNIEDLRSFLKKSGMQKQAETLDKLVQTSSGNFLWAKLVTSEAQDVPALPEAPSPPLSRPLSACFNLTVRHRCSKSP